MTVTTTTPASREATCLPATEPAPPDDVCFVCDEPTTETIAVPCVDGCCDRGMCLDCATRLGYPID